jgi:hypothetical protein
MRKRGESALRRPPIEVLRTGIPMNQLAAWGFIVAAVLFGAAGVLPAARGGTFRPAYVAVGAFFLIFGAALKRRRAAR